MAVGSLRVFGVINDAPSDVDGVALEGEAIVGGLDGEGNVRDFEGEGKADIFGGEGKTARFAGDADTWLLDWDRKSCRGDGWRGGVWLGQLGLVGDRGGTERKELCSWAIPLSPSSSSSLRLSASDKSSLAAAGLTGELAALFLGL